MPNHVENFVRLYPDAPTLAQDKKVMSEIVKFLGLAKKDGATFDVMQLCPYPAEWKAQDDDFNLVHRGKMTQSDFSSKWGSETDAYNRGGMEWRIANWGTKWGAYSVSWDKKEKVARYETAWSPLKQSLFVELSKRFPLVIITLEYYECGMGYCGGYTVQNGEVDGVWECQDYRGFRGG